jgi:hypothetical protein
MEKINFTKQVFPKPQVESTINTNFTQLVNVSATASVAFVPTIDEFFQYYQDLFFQIPKFGETNSHEYLVKTSGAYIEGNQTNDTIQALIEEINTLRQENLGLQQSQINKTIADVQQTLSSISNG